MQRSLRGLAIAALLTVTACAPNALTAPTTPAQTVYDVKAGLIAAEDVVLGYEQAKCGGVAPCTAAGAIQLNQAIITADAAVNVAETAVKANSTDTTAVTTAQAAVQALQALVVQFVPATAASPPDTTSAASSNSTGD